MKKIQFKKFALADQDPLVVISGPCIIESEEHTLFMAAELKRICESFGVNLIFKASYDKANRSSYYSFRGPGIDEGLKILEKVKKQFDLPILTDVHTVQEARQAAKICDVIQIPAFMCRQTDLVVAAGETGAIVNVKKGQFLAPWDMDNIIKKLQATGNDQIILTERGTSFGYNNLVCDMRGIQIMKDFGYPVCFDATHAVQKPGGLGDQTGGDRAFAPILAKSALAAGANCLFIECHDHPELAKSDAAVVMDLKEFEVYLPQFKELYELIQKQ